MLVNRQAVLDRNSTEPTAPYDANSRSVSAEILRLLWTPEIHYHVHKSQPLAALMN